MKLYSSLYKSPLGYLLIVCSDYYLTEVSYADNCVKSFTADKNILCSETEKQLSEYFYGKRKEFTIPFSFIRGTEFQKKVWMQLTEIKYGQTVSYKDIACAVGNPKACRAVGNANRKNPISIIVPCHRVINSNGSLNGYAGGVDKKQKLLHLEAGSSLQTLNRPFYPLMMN